MWLLWTNVSLVSGLRWKSCVCKHKANICYDRFLNKSGHFLQSLLTLIKRALKLLYEEQDLNKVLVNETREGCSKRGNETNKSCVPLIEVTDWNRRKRSADLEINSSTLTLETAVSKTISAQGPFSCCCGDFNHIIFWVIWSRAPDQLLNGEIVWPTAVLQGHQWWKR